MNKAQIVFVGIGLISFFNFGLYCGYMLWAKRAGKYLWLRLHALGKACRQVFVAA